MKKSMLNIVPFIVALTMMAAAGALAEDWIPVRDEATLRGLFSDTQHTATLKRGVEATAAYKSDGTGILKAWGDTFERQWKVEDGMVGLLIDGQWLYLSIEKNATVENEYRATRKDTGEQVVFQVEGANVVAGKVPATDSGGDVAPSADEIAKKLANPNTPLASLNFKLQYRTFEGDLPNADDQEGTTLLFQPAFPFPLANGDVVFFRPAIPLQFDQPVFNSGKLDFDSESGLGDITFDLAYGRTTKTGLLWAAGIISTIPTATEDTLGADRWTLGPEFLIGKLTKTYVLGAFPNHQWDIGGSGDADISLTTTQFFVSILPGGGWNYGTSPIMSYNWESEEWTVPLNFNFGKTVILGGRPWKLSAEFNYYVEQPDAFGPEWMIGLNITPVVENVMARWFK